MLQDIIIASALYGKSIFFIFQDNNYGNHCSILAQRLARNSHYYIFEIHVSVIWKRKTGESLQPRKRQKGKFVGKTRRTLHMKLFSTIRDIQRSRRFRRPTQIIKKHALGIYRMKRNFIVFVLWSFERHISPGLLFHLAVRSEISRSGYIRYSWTVFSRGNPIWREEIIYCT